MFHKYLSLCETGLLSLKLGFINHSILAMLYDIHAKVHFKLNALSIYSIIMIRKSIDCLPVKFAEA